ncbi:hypothetical protein AGABI2DRAFT_139685 [Agaricus bisporus var. bisporus H97]|uniref:hypothetical protein n=1 Tax=Agaricus bisporus var. bisporus (strain H97 / ATCC MYA-4626 / FGSC 10389) TaxID=936046 RepID=UPI00029F61CE|nr:hypothetical protein AGABI2DRAFT_139685 [Agaricus bisporus var. bisporus H97]EKV41965.1 hypothetical protein AGABI2DRAFT_139685 [Agaricus bisporus var. bisporus H97]
MLFQSPGDNFRSKTGVCVAWTFVGDASKENKSTKKRVAKLGVFLVCDDDFIAW